MNFNELKKEWHADDAEDMKVSGDMLKLNQAKTPIDAIRRKMKHEFVYQLATLCVMFLFPYIFGFSPAIRLLYLCFYAITCGFTAYYFFRFYRFYKNSYDMGVASRKNVNWFFYEMRLNIELYKALTYIIAFVGLAFTAVYFFMERGAVLGKIAAHLSPVYIMINCFVSVILVGVITESWAWYYYGKDLKRLKKVIDELDDEE